MKDRYFVQWVTEWDNNNRITQVRGYCVRDMGDSQWKSVFEHKDETVCKKVCEILNEGEK